MLKFPMLCGAALFGIVFFHVPSSSAEEGAAPVASAFGKQFADLAPVSAFQSQVVYYRPNGVGLRAGAANVYVDREFHTALLPGGFTAFCVAPGQHSLGAYVNDAPKYAGKTSDVYSTQLEAGKTYFLQVREDGYGAPLPVTRDAAQGPLATTRTQVHALSRASTVVACDYQPMPAVAKHKDYALSSDVLFAFGKSGVSDMTSGGRMAIRTLVAQLQKDDVKLDRIQVIGHTDPIGSAASNQLLGLKRAQTVRRLLVENGLSSNAVSASSVGASEADAFGCELLKRSEQIGCYSEDRKVVVRVNTGR